MTEMRTPSDSGATEVAQALMPPALPTHAASVPIARLPGRSGLRVIARVGTILLLTALLYFSLSKAPLREIWQVLGRLQFWQIAVLLCVDAGIYALISARWWFVVHAEQRAIRFVPLIIIRISVFAVSYFTIGPQIGGEPLQVLYLRNQYGLSYTRATASVLMDKLFELLGNFVLLAFGLVAVLSSGMLGVTTDLTRVWILLLLLLIAWPPLHILLLYKRIYPIGTLLHWIGRRRAPTKALRFVRASEYLAGHFCQRHPGPMVAGALVSLIASAATVSEYALITSFVHIGLPFWQLVTAWTIGWLSFVVPLPGGLGALEASQVFVLGHFGISAAAAVGVILIIRGRDLLIGGLGLLFAADAARKA
jgi:glycosyltransferase 2 family protein